MTIEVPSSRSLTTLFTDLLRESRELVRTEVRLVRAELSDKVTQVQTAGIALIAAAVCVLVALIVLSQALVVALATVMQPVWAALLVALVFLVVATILFVKARSDLKPANLVPDRSASQLNKDSRMVKEHLS
jgi:uncharacterized membrane protein YqjE